MKINTLSGILDLTGGLVLQEVDQIMSRATGKIGVLEKLESENNERARGMLRYLGIKGREPEEREVFQKLLALIEKNEEGLHTFLGGDGGKEFINFGVLIEKGRKIMTPKPLFVLKKDVFKSILTDNPPPNILKAFGYGGAKELFAKEKLEEVASALRFMEDTEWMHATFDKAYTKLKPSDFEEREVEVVLLSPKWLEAGKEFVEKKRHNLSHLKELGLIFIIPIKIDLPGELIRVFTLYLHYLYEVGFYSKLFKLLPRGEGAFGNGFVSLLRGDVLSKTPPHKEGGMNWLVVQRYLEKDNPNDPRLFVPHVNPEAIHWEEAINVLCALDGKSLAEELGVWRNLGWVAGYFAGSGKHLVSFNVVDLLMSLVKQHDGTMYTYHQHEALWNEIFARYVGKENLEKITVKNLSRGFIQIPEDLGV